MGSDISLTGAQRLALIDLKENAYLSSRTQLRLSSGRKINSVTDDSVNYFKAKSLQDRARDFNNLQAEIGQAITHLEVSLEAIAGLEKILSQMKGILEASRSHSAAERVLANTALKTLGAQFRELVNDASYGGANLLNSTSLGRTVHFGVRSTSKLDLPGLDFIDARTLSKRVFSTEMFSRPTQNFIYTRLLTVVGLSLIGRGNTNVGVVDSAVKRLDDAISRLRGHAQSLGSNVAVLQARATFTDKYVTWNTVGAEKYILADMNQEGANLVALLTRQQLGIQALSVAGQQQRAILTLLQ
ncbi:MAG: hypothetical protein HRT36_08520 [Alphaproteobacteria bacterium]|nr:hypothetical protein [Alphaproteobacteria bacterium]